MPILSPSQIVIDTSALPTAIQNAIATIDTFLTNWVPSERFKVFTFAWASVGGFTSAKQQAVDRLIEAYRKRGWTCEVTPDSTTTGSYSIRFELPG